MVTMDTKSRWRTQNIEQHVGVNFKLTAYKQLLKFHMEVSLFNKILSCDDVKS